MKAQEDLKRALLLLQQACAEVQRAAQSALDELSRETPEAAPPPPPPPTPPPPAPLVHLRELHDPAVAAGVDPEDAAFARQAHDRYAELPEDRKKVLLGESARLLDALMARYFFLLPDELRGRADAIVRELAASVGAIVQPEEFRVPSREPAGSVVVEVSPRRKAVSSGRASAVAEALVEAARAAGRARAENPAARAAALEEMMKFWADLADADAAKELVILRYAVNALHPLALPEVDSLVRLLSARGIAEMHVNVGGMFDDTYGLNRYERRRVPSSAPTGTILRVLQRGFVGPDGNPIQRATLAVSGGEV